MNKITNFVQDENNSVNFLEKIKSTNLVNDANLALIQAYLEVIDTDDIGYMLTFFSDDIIWEIIPPGYTFKGFQQVQNFTNVSASNRVHDENNKIKIHNMFTDGESLCVEYHHGAYVPSLHITRENMANYCLIFHMKDGKFDHVREYIFGNGFLGRLGNFILKIMFRGLEHENIEMGKRNLQERQYIPESANQQLITDYLNIVNTDDYDSMASLVTENCTWNLVPPIFTLNGSEEIRVFSHMAGGKRTHSDELIVQVLQWFTDGEYLCVEYYHGACVGRRKVKELVSFVFHMKEGKFDNIHEYIYSKDKLINTGLKLLPKLFKRAMNNKNI